MSRSKSSAKKKIYSYKYIPEKSKIPINNLIVQFKKLQKSQKRK